MPITVGVGGRDVGVGAREARIVAVVEGAPSPDVRDLRVKTVLLVDGGLYAFDDLLRRTSPGRR